MSSLTNTPNMELIAHRGCADQFPENTLAAIRGVVEYVDRIELDVFQCGSDEIILFHDRSTAALTGDDFDVTTTDYETLRELTVLDLDQYIPTLAEAYETIPASVDVQFDLKQPGIAEAVVDVTQQFDNELYICSTDTDALTEAHAAPWDASLGYVSFAYFQDEPVDPTSITDSELDETLSQAEGLNCSFIEVPYELCLETDIVERAHDRGLDVVAWTIRTEAQLNDVAEAGVDGAMIDRIDII